MNKVLDILASWFNKFYEFMILTEPLPPVITPTTVYCINCIHFIQDTSCFYGDTYLQRKWAYCKAKPKDEIDFAIFVIDGEFKPDTRRQNNYYLCVACNREGRCKKYLEKD